MPLLAITRHYKKPEVATIAAKGDAKDLKNSFQGSRRSGAPGRLLPQLGRLVGAECVGRRARQLRVSVECLYKSSKLITFGNISYRSLQHVKFTLT